jgi:hypothetical protein
MVAPHRERVQWWTTERTAFADDGVCAACASTVGYGQFGDGWRCLGCGRQVVTVPDDRDLGGPTDGC